MASSWKIVICIACVAIIAGVSTVWWQYSIATERKLREIAGKAQLRAEQGDIAAEFKLASLYYNGKGVSQDYIEAVRWYRKAAGQGYAKAQFNLGSMYYDGKGVPKDYVEAVRWYRQAAGQGDVKAQAALGYAYYHGEGVPQDYAESVHWYRKAAEQGDPLAQQGLGYMYANGRGVPLDRIEAVRWYRRAAEQGDTSAKRALESLGRGSAPSGKTRYIELGTAIIAFIAGLLLLPFGRPLVELRHWRQASVGILGLVFLANAGLSLYAFTYDIRYSSYHDAFHLVRGILVATAILIVVMVVLPAKKNSTKLGVGRK